MSQKMLFRMNLMQEQCKYWPQVFELALASLTDLRSRLEALLWSWCRPPWLSWPSCLAKTSRSECHQPIWESSYTTAKTYEPNQWAN